MSPETLEQLAELVAELDRAGVQALIADGDRLRYRPRSAMTPDLAKRLATHKYELIAALQPAGSTRDAEPEPSIVPANATDERYLVAPCPDCGGLMFWWDGEGERQCTRCRPPRTAIRILERTVRLRRKYRIPDTTNSTELLAYLKLATATCNGAKH
jgi:hypothetical protein